MSDELITLSTLRARGWTDALIKAFRLRPDKEVPNPYYRKAPPMKLYALARVKSLEADPRFAEKQLGREKRKAAATKAVETKTARLLEWVKGLERLFLRTGAVPNPRSYPALQ